MAEKNDTSPGMIRESTVTGKLVQGQELQGKLLKLTRFTAVFEMYNPPAAVRLSEVLADFQVKAGPRLLYAGKAVVRGLINTGPATVVCEVTLSESAWMDLSLAATNGQLNKRLDAEYRQFMQEWQKLYKVLPEFKLVVADLQSYLAGLQLWLNQVELEVRAAAVPDRPEVERRIVTELARPVTRSIDTFIDQFEAIAGSLEADLEPAHQMYFRRQMHPLLLSSPFASRTYHKPLGYAGDYEMVDMMLRPPQEGDSLFAKVINVWLLGQSPAEAHRNRVDYLCRKLVAEAVRMSTHHKVAQVFNLGCGPAQEIQRFFNEHGHLSVWTDFTLLDFNEETLQYARRALGAIQSRQTAGNPVQFIKKSVHQILKDRGRAGGLADDQKYDLVYCAGLFDYLSDPVCKRLMNIFYEMLAPGGLLLATNVSDAMNASRPFRYSMEYLLDWHLIYRNGAGFATLAPDEAPAENVRVITENIGVNVFIEVRKPGDA
ncbi:MAG TPA: class I SAM-dependent methyltransferase [Dongiaceae bacterium]|nr:class I SAM-dependent methyltransferase [Dongiaceae bacterium]